MCVITLVHINWFYIVAVLLLGSYAMSTPTEKEVRSAVASVTAPTGAELWAANRQLALWRKSGHVFDQAFAFALYTHSVI